MQHTSSARLRHLLDRRAILDRIYSYARGVDRHDDELMAEVFHPDAIDDHGRFVGGVADFIQWVNGVHEATEEGHAHNITTHTCEISGDEAHAESYIVWALRNKGGKTALLGSGRYIDRLERRDGQWKISLRRVIREIRVQADASSFEQFAKPYLTGKWDRSDLSFKRPFALIPELRHRLPQDVPAPIAPGTYAPARHDLDDPDGRQVALSDLADRQDILDCINLHARSLDRRDAALENSLLASSMAAASARDPHSSLDAWAGALCGKPVALSMHNVAGHVADVGQGVASAETNVIYFFRCEGEDVIHIAGGRFLDQLIRHDGKWLLADRRIATDWCLTSAGSQLNAMDGTDLSARDLSDISYQRPLVSPLALG